jgi:hypothetical protein
MKQVLQTSSNKAVNNLEHSFKKNKPKSTDTDGHGRGKNTAATFVIAY